MLSVTENISAQSGGYSINYLVTIVFFYSLINFIVSELPKISSILIKYNPELNEKTLIKSLLNSDITN